MAILVLFFLHAGTAGMTLYEVDLRKHDYSILVLAGQLRVVCHAMVHESEDYLMDASGTDAEHPRSRKQYLGTLNDEIKLYDQVITGYRLRRLPPELTGRDAPLTCNWDDQSKDQLNQSVAQWNQFRTGLFQAFGPDPGQPDLVAGSRFIGVHGDDLIASTDQLNKAFQYMMEGKLEKIHRTNQLALVLSALLSLGLLVALYRKIAKPLALAMAGFDRVANGDLGYQIPMNVDNEIGAMSASFNHLSSRLRSLFHLTDQINEGINLYDTLRLVCDEFQAFLPVAWVGVFILTPDGHRYALERLHAASPGAFRENENFDADLGLPPGTLAAGHPHAVNDLQAAAQGLPAESLMARLRQDGQGSAVLLPLSSGGDQQALLVIAAPESGAYLPVHVDFLTNVAAQISHVLDKTMFMEGLVIAAVEGLAKLAESRDPETGGHLVRMSLYSALVAEELAAQPGHGISPAYIREVFRFAPMHDIGKVGIRDDILLKPGRLDPAERAEMEHHPVIGGQVLVRCEEQMNRLGHSIFKVGIEIATGHHEKFDGSGYPLGLQGAAIPLSARIIAVADVFDALTSKRPYKEAWPLDKALATIRQDAGSHFDPEVVAAFDRALPRILAIYEKLKHT